MRSSLALPVPTTPEAAAFESVDDGQRCRKKFADFKAEGSCYSDGNRSLAHSINPSGFASMLGAFPISNTLHAFQRRYLSTGNCGELPVVAHQVADLHEKRVESEEQRKHTLEVMQAELAQLKKTLSVMLAVVSEKQVPEEEKGFAKYFGALEPSIQHRSIERKEDDIRLKESEISTLKMEIEQSEESLIGALQGRLKKHPRWVFQLTQSELCNREFLGREAQLKLAMETLRLVGDSKEHQTPVLVYSSPRQGKSRLLDEIAKRGMSEFGASKLFVVVMSFNGSTKGSFGQADCATENLAARFFCRMLLASISEFSPNTADEFSARFPFLKTLTAEAFDRILRKVHGLSDQRMWLLADEFAKCYLSALGEEGLLRKVIPDSLKAQVSALYQFMAPLPGARGNKIILSGFTDSAWQLLQSASGRPVATVPLPLIAAKERHRFKAMRSTLWNYYLSADVPFPTLIYEAVKSCVGMLGNWIELCARGKRPEDLTDMEVPWVLVLWNNKNVYQQIAERYLRLWGAGSLNMETFLKEEAKYFDAVDVGPSVMFLPLTNRNIAHPVPFYALAYEFAQPNNLTLPPLLFQLNMVYHRIAYFVAKMNEARKAGLLEEVKDFRGTLVEEVAFMTLRLQCYALVSLKEPRSLTAWLMNKIPCASLPTESIMLSETKPLLKEPAFGEPTPSPPKFSLKTLFNDAKCFDNKALKQHAEQFCSEVDTYGGMLMAPDRNPGFDFVLALNATKGTKQGLVLVLVETKCIKDAGLAEKTAKKYDGKVFFNRGPLLMQDPKGENPSMNSQAPPHSALDEEGETANLSTAQENSLTFCAVRKAYDTLNGLNPTLPYFKKPVLHVCYVYLTLGKFVPQFETSKNYWVTKETLSEKMSLRAAIAGTERSGATVSLHVVAGQKGLEDFFTGAVYHAIPEAEGYLETSASQRGGIVKLDYESRFEKNAFVSQASE